MAGNTQLLPSFPQKLGKYEIIEKIGEGGYSCVYRGFDPLIRRPVAIKTCPAADPETRERFYREAQIAGNLDHPNIVKVYDLFLEQGAPYLVQELLGGDDLDVRIERRELISFPEKLFHLLQIARGLEYAHSRGVIHRDIKPANVRILEDGSAKILDFGIAKLIHYTSDLTQAGMTVGTAAYLAPEQIRGEEATPETDIFSFGVLAYELLTYVRPFGRETISETFYQTLNRQPAALTVHWAQCPSDLVEVVSRCLRKEPAQRFGSCREVVRQLEEVRDRLRGEWSPVDNPAATRVLPTDPDLLRTHQVPLNQPTHDRPENHAASSAIHTEPRPRAGSQVDLPLRPRPSGMSIAGSTRRRRRPRALPLLLLALLLAGAGAAWHWLPGTELGNRIEDLLGVSLEKLQGTVPLTATNDPPAQSEQEVEPATEPEQPVAVEPAPADTVESPSSEVAAPAATVDEQPEAPAVVDSATLAFERVWSPGIQVSVDGAAPIALGRSRTVQLEPGSHSLTFSIDNKGFKASRTVRLEVEAGESRSITVPIRPPGQLTIQAHLGSPQGLVAVDGGRPLPTPVRGLRIAPGERQLTFYSRESPGAARILTSVNVTSGQESIITFDLESGREPHLRERPAKP
jgi:serine/threonine protein kinase